MNFRQHSLRQKVMLGYLIGALTVSVIALFNWKNFDNIEAMVRSGDKVADFFDTALEIRRFEKNYFLYGKDEDYRTLIAYVGRAESLIEKNAREYELFAYPGTITELKKDLASYSRLLGVPPDDASGMLDWERSLREKGKAIVTMAEALSTTERRVMQATLRASTRTMMLSLVILGITGFATGTLFYRMFVKPLRVLEGHMNRLAAGEYSYIPMWSKDRELASLNRAFNRMLAELEWRQQHLLRSEKLASLGTLLFGVAHDLNNPLSNISTSAQILREEMDGSDAGYKKELLAQIEEETDRARDIVRALLDFSKTGSRETVNLARAVNDSIRFIKNEVPPKIEMAVSVPESITVFADKQQLQQVFLNLIKNAVEAMPGEGRISISARVANDHAEIRFSDTGAGIRPEMISKIFDPFFTTKGAKTGYGLGLFIVHNIIGEHGGTIDVESEVGVGTTFLIKLPLKETGKDDG